MTFNDNNLIDYAYDFYRIYSIPGDKMDTLNLLLNNLTELHVDMSSFVFNRSINISITKLKSILYKHKIQLKRDVLLSKLVELGFSVDGLENNTLYNLKNIISNIKRERRQIAIRARVEERMYYDEIIDIAYARTIAGRNIINERLSINRDNELERLRIEEETKALEYEKELETKKRMNCIHNNCSKDNCVCDECPVCYETVGKSKIVLNCGHLFCVKCILTHYNNSNKCPMCRGEFN